MTTQQNLTHWAVTLHGRKVFDLRLLPGEQPQEHHFESAQRECGYIYGHAGIFRGAIDIILNTEYEARQEAKRQADALRTIDMEA